MATCCRVIGACLVILIGVALALGGIQLWKGGPAAWPDVTANDMTVKRTSIGMIALGTVLLLSGAAALANLRWGGHAAAITVIIVVAAAFWGNYALFGNIRLIHTGTNIIVAAIVLILLWFGYDGHAR